MLHMIRDIYRHQAWADAEHWRVFLAHTTFLDNEQVRARLHHMHLVQWAFLAIARQQPLRITALADFSAVGELRDYARTHHEEASQYFAALSPSQLEENVVIPWFRNPPLQITLGQAFMQAAMHSHYHRGQNAAQFRAIGGDPPLTDLIAWYWKGQPHPWWD